jgi:hypothetical protein
MLTSSLDLVLVIHMFCFSVCVFWGEYFIFIIPLNECRSEQITWSVMFLQVLLKLAILMYDCRCIIAEQIVIKLCIVIIAV